MYGVDNWIFNIWGSYMERKNVAVFIANIYRNMTKETQYGLIEAA